METVLAHLYNNGLFGYLTASYMYEKVLDRSKRHRLLI